MSGTVPARIGARRIRWAPATRLAPEEPDRITTPQIIDSWLLNNGQVRGLHRHEARFAHSCDRLAGGPTSKSVLQPASPLRTSTVFWVPATSDPRQHTALQTTATPLTDPADHPHSTGATR